MLTRKQQLLIASALVIVVPIIGILVQLQYWDSIDWNLISLSTERILLSIVGNIAYISVLYLSKSKAKGLWIAGFIWTSFNIFTLVVKLGG